MMTKYVVAYTVTWGGGCCCSHFKGEQTEAQTGEQTLQGTEEKFESEPDSKGEEKGPARAERARGAEVAADRAPDFDQVGTTRKAGRRPSPRPPCRAPCDVTDTQHLASIFRTALAIGNVIPTL